MQCFVTMNHLFVVHYKLQNCFLDIMPESGSGSDLCTTIPAFIKLIIEKIIVALIRSRTTIIPFRIKNIREPRHQITGHLPILQHTQIRGQTTCHHPGNKVTIIGSSSIWENRIQQTERSVDRTIQITLQKRLHQRLISTMADNHPHPSIYKLKKSFYTGLKSPRFTHDSQKFLMFAHINYQLIL